MESTKATWQSEETEGLESLLLLCFDMCDTNMSLERGEEANRERG